MTIECESRQGVAIFKLTGRLDAESSRDAQAVLLGRLDFTPLHAVLDITGVEYISSTGIRAILEIVKKVESSAGKIAITGLSSNTREVFDLCGLGRIVPIQSDIESAFASVTKV